MEKLILFLGILLISTGAIAQKRSAKKTPRKSSSLVLKTEMDSIYYAYGANLFERNGLGDHLQRMGILSDTSQVKTDYRNKIEAASDARSKAVLRKEMRTKIDSIVKANNVSMTQFIIGLREGMATGKIKGAYIMGLSIGQQFKDQMLPSFAEQMLGFGKEELDDKFDDNLFIAGIETAALKKAKLMDKPSLYFDRKIHEMQNQAQARTAERLKVKYKDRIAAEADFLYENKSKDGVVTLPSGVQYEIIEQGDGKKPAVNDKVRTHYHGTFMDGTVFDSSIDRGNPATFSVNGVIKGWSEVLQLMPVGSKWKVYIPYDLAYGEAEMGSIPAFSLLIFDIELLGIEGEDEIEDDSDGDDNDEDYDTQIEEAD